MTGQVLVAGIGNVFLRDDAFGVEVSRRLIQRALPPGVVVKDFGIRSYDLAYALMEDWNLVILVDALSRGGDPGTLYLFEPDMRTAEEMPSLDAHTMSPENVLQLVRALGGKIRRLFVVGCEPEILQADEEDQFGLSASVHAQLEEGVRMVEELIVREYPHPRAA
jgi:hydrogenase maturation protease